jgi:hypothetical protein
MSFLFFIVDERDEMDIVVLRQQAEQMKRPDTVAAIWGVRQSMGEEQDLPALTQSHALLRSRAGFYALRE